MVNTAIQLYTLRKFDVSEPTKVRIASETAVDGVEMEYTGMPSEATLEALEETGLEVAGVSVGVDDLHHSLDDVAAVCTALDCGTIILGHLDKHQFESAEATRETAALLSSFAARVEERGLRFLYHTHRYEFTPLDDGTHFDLLAEETDDSVKFELDLGWIGVTGTDPRTMVDAVGDRTVSVHLKDMRFEDEEFVNLGEGDLDIEETAQAAIDAGVEWLVYEHEDPSDPVESVVTGASKLRKFQKAKQSPDTHRS